MPPSNRGRTSPQRSPLARESPPHDRLDVPRALLGEALRRLEERLVFRPPRGRHVGAEVRRRHHHPPPPPPPPPRPPPPPPRPAPPPPPPPRPHPRRRPPRRPPHSPHPP